jgi:hypothetical protein
VDKALQARSYCFARYADDCNVYVGSKKAGERVMTYLRKLYTGFKLQINEAPDEPCSITRNLIDSPFLACWLKMST